MKTARVTNIIGGVNDYVAFVAIYEGAIPETYKVRVKKQGKKSVSIHTLRSEPLWEGVSEKKITRRSVLATFVLEKLENKSEN